MILALVIATAEYMYIVRGLITFLEFDLLFLGVLAIFSDKNRTKTCSGIDTFRYGQNP